MVDDKRLFNDVARVASSAAGALGGIKSRMEGEIRDHAERLLSRMNMVTREEYDVVAAMARAARAEQEQLSERVAALEAALAAQTAKPARVTRRQSPQTGAANPKPTPDATPPKRSAARRRVKS